MATGLESTLTTRYAITMPIFSRNTLHYGLQTYLELHRVRSGSEPNNVNQFNVGSVRSVPNDHNQGV